jgi:hypothetical protein
MSKNEAKVIFTPISAYKRNFIICVKGIKANHRRCTCINWTLLFTEFAIERIIILHCKVSCKVRLIHAVQRTVLQLGAQSISVAYSVGRLIPDTSPISKPKQGMSPRLRICQDND